MVAVLVGGAGAGLDADAGGDAGQHDLGDPAAAQLQVEVGAVEGAPVPLGDGDVLVVPGQFVDDDVPALREAAGAAGSVVAAAYGVRSVGGGGDPYEDDREALCAEGVREQHGPLHDLGGGVGGEARVSDDAVLQVDDDEGGVRVERGDCHGQAFRRGVPVRVRRDRSGRGAAGSGTAPAGVREAGRLVRSTRVGAVREEGGGGEEGCGGGKGGGVGGHGAGRWYWGPRVRRGGVLSAGITGG